MCPSENPSNQPLLNRLFDSEAGSDITFLVGQGNDAWRFPGHRCVLSESNPVFKAMLSHLDPSSKEDVVVPIIDVDGKAFDLLLRYLYKEDVNIQSVPTALMTLYAAQKYLCPGLMRLCICYLDRSVDVTNVLQIYEHLRFYSGQCSDASAPPVEHLHVENSDADQLEDMSVMCKSLLYNCLLFIDTNAAEVMSQEGWEDLKRDSLGEIVCRDTLDVPERVVYAAVERWSTLECKRFKLELSSDNLRSVIGDQILFSVRYLLMTPAEFFEGPMKGNLLNKNEVTTLYGYLHDMPVTNTTGTITPESLKRMREKRRTPRVAKIQLGKRPSSDEKKKTKEDIKKKKKTKKKKEKEESRKCSTCLFDYFFCALACIFD